MQEIPGPISPASEPLCSPLLPTTTHRFERIWPARDDELRALWEAHEGRIVRVARAMGLRRGQVDGRSRLLGLQFKGAREPKVIRAGSPPDLEGRTLFPGQVRGAVRDVLKTGRDNRKLGSWVTKGLWKGFYIYYLTLEERATCPRSCHEYLSCYGNNMRWAVRYDRGLSLELAIWKNLDRLQKRHGAFVVRLHQLGDFYSESYVDMWEAALDHFPGLNVFGYTAWGSKTPIGKKVEALRDRSWERFAIRTSGARVGPRTTVIARENLLQPGAILCPVEVGQQKNCGSCGLCWAPAARHKAVAFLRH